MDFDFTIRKDDTGVDPYGVICPHNAAAAILLNEHFGCTGAAEFTDADVASGFAFIADAAEVPGFIAAVVREDMSAACPDFGVEINPPV